MVAKVEFHCGELFPRAGSIVTNLETDSRAMVRFYNKRGTAEQWIKEGKQHRASHTGYARSNWTAVRHSRVVAERFSRGGRRLLRRPAAPRKDLITQWRSWVGATSPV